VIPSHFAYEAPESAGEVAALLAGGDARVLAGGTWVVPELCAGVSRPAVVIDLRRARLDGIESGEGAVRIGATATYADLIGSALVRERLPLLHEMARGITGGWAIRSQGTIGGALAAARPQSDAPAVLVALGDQPTVGAVIVDALVDAWRRGGAAIVAPTYAGERGNPVLFDRQVIPELAALAEDAGARRLISRDPSRVRLVAFPFAPPPDVDTPADLARLAAELARASSAAGRG
jgi:hypothetical protein